MTVQLSTEESAERDYLAHRASVLAMLRAEFGGVPDHEELYQEAWTEALELRARGKEIQNLGGLLRTIAWRRARDQLRKNRPDPLDPDSAVFAIRADPAPLPDEQAEVHLDSAVVRQVVDSLDERQAAVIKLRFDRHMTSREIQEALGVSPKRLEKIVTEAYASVETALTPLDDGMSPWQRRQRSMLLACETGIATRRQRARVRRMLRDDPMCRAMLHELRSTLRGIAATLPMPLVLDPSDERGGRVRGALWGRLGDIRDQLVDVVGRISGHAPSVEQAGSGGLAGLGAGAAAKVAIACVLAAGGTALCVVDLGPPPKKKAEVRTTKRPPPRKASLAVANTKPPVVAEKPKPTKQSHKTRAKAREAGKKPAVSASQATSAPPSPAPANSTEFGVGDTGSSSAPAEPAPAPSDGGGEFTP